METKTVVISGTGFYVPPDVITNEELVASFNAYVQQFNGENAAAIQEGRVQALKESSVEFIEKASGICQRHVVDKKGILDTQLMRPQVAPRANDALSLQAEMAVSAARRALQAAGKSASDIQAVIVGCSNFQRPYPAIAIEVQAALGIEGFALDLNVACSSATFALQTAVDSINNNHANGVLVIDPEICSAHVDFRDRDSHFIFGDGCTAMVVEDIGTAQKKEVFEIVGTRLQTVFSSAIRNNAGFLDRAWPATRDDPDKLFKQEGRRVFREVVPLVIEFLRKMLEDHRLEASALKRLWLHQANAHMNEMIATKLLGHAPSKTEAPLILNEYANTSSAGSVIAFHLHHADLYPGDWGVICSFGAGYSVGCALLRRL